MSFRLATMVTIDPDFGAVVDLTRYHVFFGQQSPGSSGCTLPDAYKPSPEADTTET